MQNVKVVIMPEPGVSVMKLQSHYRSTFEAEKLIISLPDLFEEESKGSV